MDRNHDKDNAKTERDRINRPYAERRGPKIPEEIRAAQVQDAIEKAPMDNDENSLQMVDRQAKVIQLRTAGFSFQQIGKALQISQHAAYIAFTTAIKKKNKELHESTEEFQFIAHSRAEVIINRLWQKAMPNDLNEPLNLEAMDRIIKLIQMDSKIMGYEAPQKRQVDVQMISTSVSMVVDRIIQAIPEEYVGDIFRAVEDGMIEVESLADRNSKAISVKNTA